MQNTHLIRQRLPLHEYMQDRGVRFVRKSPDAWTAHCFAHEDKTPSLVVSIRKGLFNCFSTGCEVGGDVVSFHEQFDSVDRLTAEKQLSGRLGIQTSNNADDPIHEIMQRATECCAIALLSTPKALEYVKGRGVTEEVICQFQVGYCPSPSWLRAQLGDVSSETFKSMEFDSNKYRNSLVLPCIHPTSGLIAHYVRPFGNSSSKYMGPSNSNSTRWKGMMFGLDQARRHVREKGSKVILVEGQFDALVLHSRLFTNTVCMLGSHPTADQFKLLESLNIPRAVVLFDGDVAGKAGAESALRMGCATKPSIAFLPEGDPDDYVLNHGAQALQKVLDDAVLPVDFIIDKYAGQLKGGSDDIAVGLSSCVEELNRLPRPDFLAGVTLLSNNTGIPNQQLLELVPESAQDLRGVIESERHVLAMCIRDPSQSLFVSGLPEDVWVLGRHKRIYGIIGNLVDEGAKHITEELVSRRLADPSANGSLSGLFTLEASNIELHVSRMREAHARRELAACAKRLGREALDERTSAHTTASMFMQALSRVTAPDSKCEWTAGAMVEDAMEYVHDRMANPDSIPGIDLGENWPSITKVLLGLQANRLYLVGAGPKVGKTSLALNWALETSIKKGVKCLWVNLEMSQRDLMLRLFAMLTGISSLRIQAGALSSKEKELLDVQAQLAYSSNFHILNAYGMTVQEIVSSIRKYVYVHSIQMAIIDYIQLLNVSGADRLDYWERHALVSTSLKEAVNANLGVPLIALSQLGRPAAHEGSSSGSFIGGSYKYVQDCDAFLGLRVRSDKEMETGDAGNLVLNVEYNRHGPQDVYARIHFNRDNLRMQEVG